MRHTTKITGESIATSGLPSDYRRAIAQYIWNSFDADATRVDLNFESDDLNSLVRFTISDNGTGIEMEELSETFGRFMDSKKKSSYSEITQVQGKKGKGRYSFFNFCTKAVWETVYKGIAGNLLKYEIEILKDDPQNFTTNDKAIVKNTPTGTTVAFSNFTKLSTELLENEDFYSYLCSEFGWFLYLNSANNFSIYINDILLNYNRVIADSEEDIFEIGDYSFKVNFIQWKLKFGDNFYFYFLDSVQELKYKKPTSFNRKGTEFFHSVYIESSYFDNFKEQSEKSLSLFDSVSQHDIIFKNLTTKIKKFIGDKERIFLKTYKATTLIEKFEKDSIFPRFKDNEYDQLRKRDLENVVKEIYTVQPKIFQDLKLPQSKAIVGFLNLLLDSEQRENILDIVGEIVNLSEEDRIDLASVLKQTKLAHIVTLVKFLETRFHVVAALKTLIFDLEHFTNERVHIQKLIEDNYWLFGEQYHLVSADKNFEILLNNYLDFIENNNGRKPELRKLDKKDKLKRPDIFICQQSDVPDSRSEELMVEENIIVELKRPNVVIASTQFRQIEDYLRFIADEPEFNSKQLRKWKFFIVGKSVDEYIKGLYQNQENRGKRFLVQEVGNYEIYAMTWDDLFRTFSIRHKHLIDKLEFKSAIKEKLEEKGIVLDRHASDYITETTLKKVP
ncbi:ATP-binding protein [Flavobacterium subsaxonicum]|uniref:ATP-binding protein n=1 Tax=Flavobacterium subsaxonicum WB 4.1-42 = DSM 21790 TaxID=1121898 RepID=A0A0A2MFJ1_9FLAO|nr:ATP-binding protein [Flavobacterium subsaxonicum]KGO91467.1 hypothetical protein Q766_17970 [Flavobacterium subsaxonicum WB 4.1-42 = DSM 21790]